MGGSVTRWFSRPVLAAAVWLAGASGCARELCDDGACGQAGAMLVPTATPGSTSAPGSTAPSASSGPTSALDSATPQATLDADAGEPGCPGTAPVRSVQGLCVACESDEHCALQSNASKYCNVVASDPTSNRCLECKSDVDCSGGRACDQRVGSCAPCDPLGNSGCASGSYCLGNPDSALNQCVECLGAEQCTDPARTVCDAEHSCVACLPTATVDAPVDQGCSEALARCATEDGPNHCVECTSDADCSGNVCDLATNSCVTCLREASGTFGDGAAVGLDFDHGCEDAAARRCLVQTTRGVEPDAGGDASFDALLDASTSAPSEELRSCVECLRGMDCETGVCDESTHECSECVEDDNCTEAATPRCNTEERMCEACDPALNEADGANPACEHFDGRGVCSPEGACVECTGEFAGACGSNVCDERPTLVDGPNATRYACQPQRKRSAHTCEDCVSDAQCQTGQACVSTSFTTEAGEVPAGYYCLLRKVTAEELGACDGSLEECGVTSCFTQAAPCTEVWHEVSVSGRVGDTCAPGATTCPGIRDFRSKMCETADDCGIPGLDDATCRPTEDVMSCAPWCLTEEDCPRTATGETFGCLNGYCLTEPDK
jgi:Cys-rich repeat protein